MPALNVSITLESETKCSIPAHKIRRSRPLPSKCLDPAQCLDIIDDMYAVYFDLEVWFIMF